MTGRLYWRWWYLRKIVATLPRCVGYTAAISLATTLARSIFDLNPPVRAHIERNLRAASIARSESGVNALAREVFEHVARFWIEVLYVPRRFRPAVLLRQVQWSPGERWEQLSRNGGSPVVFISTHLGNPIIGILALCQRWGGLTVLVDAASRVLIDAVWPGALRRGVFHAHPRLRILTIPQDTSRLEPCLTAGTPLCLLWGPRAGSGLSGTFFGQASQFRAGAIRLAHRHAARIVVWSCTRPSQPRSAFQLNFHGEIPPARRPLRRTLPDLTALIEAAVQSHPAQYLWTRT